MSKILKLLSFQIFLSLLFVSHLEAVKISSQFYSAEEGLPVEYQSFITEPIKKLNTGYGWTIITLKDLPKNKNLTIVENPLLNPEKKNNKPCNTNNNGEFIEIVAGVGYMPAEPVTYTFKCNRKQTKLTVTPNPLYVKSDVDGATIEAKLLSPEYFTMEMTGFKENEIIYFQSLAYDEHIEGKMSVNKTSSSGYLPSVIGKRGGINYLRYSRASGENLELQLPWGIEFLKYFKYYENNEVKYIMNYKEFVQEIPGAVQYFRSNRHPTAKFSTPQF